MTTEPPDMSGAVAALRAAGAIFAYLHGSYAEETAHQRSDVDVGAHFAGQAPRAWEVGVPDGVDLVVLDAAPEYLSGRIATRGRLLFDDDPVARVTWESEQRVRYLDELPYLRASAREYLETVGRRGRP